MKLTIGKETFEVTDRLSIAEFNEAMAYGAAHRIIEKHLSNELDLNAIKELAKKKTQISIARAQIVCLNQTLDGTTDMFVIMELNSHLNSLVTREEEQTLAGSPLESTLKD